MMRYALVIDVDQRKTGESSFIILLTAFIWKVLAEFEPNYQDYEEFIESRCFPKDRDKMKLILDDLGIPFLWADAVIRKTEAKWRRWFLVRIERWSPWQNYLSRMKDDDRQSSKGNQLKWYNGIHGIKLDYTGYEGLAEYMVSIFWFCLIWKEWCLSLWYRADKI